jgi:hypothetical protein
MPKITIPKAKSFSIGYQGDYFNDVIQTFGCNFSKYQSRVTPALRIYPFTTSDTVTGMGLPTDIVYSAVESLTASKYYMVSDQVYSSSDISTPFTAVGGTNFPGGLTDSDLVANWKNSEGYKILLVTEDTDLAKFEDTGSGATWDDTFWTGNLGQTALVSGIEHPMANFNRYVILGDGSNLHSILGPGSPLNGTVTTDYVVDENLGIPEVIFPDGYIINWIKCTKNRVFVGLRDESSDFSPSLICEYDLVNANPKVLQVQDGTTIGFIWNDNLNVVTKKGAVGEYTGTGFNYYAWFPCYFRDSLTLILPHRNGIDIIDGKPSFLVMSTDYDYYQSGVWVYEPNFERLYLKYSLSNDSVFLSTFGISNLSEVGLLNIVSQNSMYFFAGSTLYNSATSTTTGLYSSYKI